MMDQGTAGRRRLIAAAIGLVCAYLSAESLLPPERQPTTRAGLAAIRAYQSLGSPAMAELGVRCRYTPSCSRYAASALSHYGTLEGGVRTAGRLWRCSPWGGAGYDPAVASLKRGPLAQDETKPPRIRELTPEERKALEDAGAAAAGACALGCAGTILVSLITFAAWVFALIYVVKDAKNRGDPNAVLWIILAVFFPVIGLIVYFVARPKGDLAPCANCKNRRLVTLVKCPHCGSDAAGGVKA